MRVGSRVARFQNGCYSLDVVHQTRHFYLFAAFLFGKSAGEGCHCFEFLLLPHRSAGLLELVDEAKRAERDEIGFMMLE